MGGFRGRARHVPDAPDRRPGAAETVDLDHVTRHRIAGPVLAALPPVSPEEDPTLTELREALALLADILRAKHAAAVRTLTELVPVLEAIAPWLVLKGPVLYAQQVADLGPRPSSDLDVLVDPAGLGDALDALEGAGWRVRERNWDLLARMPFGALHLDRPDTAPRSSWLDAVARTPELDLHWDLVHRPSVRRRLRIPVGPVLARRQHVDVGGVVVPAPDPLDLAVHVAVHAVLGGGGTLGWWVDLHRALEVAVPDRPAPERPAVLLARAAELGVILPVTVALDLASAGLDGRSVPGVGPLVSRSDHRGGWPALLRTAPSSVVVASTRATGPASVAALLRMLGGAPWRGVLAVVKRTSLRRVLHLGRHLPRLFPGRALTVPKGDRAAFLSRFQEG